MDTKNAERKLASVLEHKRAASFIHTLFAADYLVGIGADCDLQVFDMKESTCIFVDNITLPMRIPIGTRAAFPIQDLADCCCIVTPECLDEAEGYVSILHEMVHCHQSRTCEVELRAGLSLHEMAMQSGDHMWELNYDFPYTNRLFCDFIRHVATWDIAEVFLQLEKIRDQLKDLDYEYMVWQVWKEGFARFVENDIRRRNGLEENHHGSSVENAGRHSHYYIGDFIWLQLHTIDENLAINIGEAFGAIKDAIAI
jgi:hypothetical protein